MTKPMYLSGKFIRDLLTTFLLVFVPAFALYLGTLAPTITWAHAGADGGDLITAALTNGVAHPPGYPTYVTLGQLFARLPIGAVAYRFNLMSAACMALAAALTSIGILRTISWPADRGRLPRPWVGTAVIAGLFFATAPMAWGQATIAEVYALNALFVAAIICLIAPLVLRGAANPAYQLTLAAFLWGASLGNSLTIAALAPMMMVAGWRSVPRNRWLAAVAFLIGLSVYLLVPLRAAMQPPINWGNAVTWQNFVGHVSAEMYHGYALALPPSEYPARLIALAQLTVEQFGWLGVVLGAIGVREILIAPGKNWRWPALTIGLYVLFSLSYSTPDSDLYLIPVWMLGAWAVARGIWAVLSRVQARLDVRQAPGSAACLLRRSSSDIILIVILIGGPLLQAASHYSAMDLRADNTAEGFARTVLNAAPPHAIVITGNDAQTFTLWYYRLAAGQRPDIAIVDARMAGYPWYDSMLRSQGSAPQLPDYDPQATWKVRLGQKNQARAVCTFAAISSQMICQ